ncbi:MAG: phenylacetate--CoA ligase family protein [Candidatus Abyssobacteria bacterium SURF_17]|uniref:Phenylacetate--CoA ligase family protein n=1 Tax=Candidatus Abyssobacteria bacterium SURF_17 TaxID=2093361 RepID=A0A419EQ97_9BACT|nr:MAG: phenylacetate--CoA ligase family protein [Candidatus Abyssubacteria bacterium SURF_17]
MPRKKLEKIESAKLKQQLAYVYAKSPFYKKKFDEAGVILGQIRSVTDLPKLPFTTKDELRQTQAKLGGLGGHQCAPMRKIIRIQGTSGTTGKPLFIGLTRRDANLWKDLFARHGWTGGLRPDDVMINPADFGLFIAGLSESVGAEHLGMTVIPLPLVSSGMQKLLDIMLEFRPTVMFSTPSATMFLEKVVREMLHMEPMEIGFKKGFLSGETLTDEDRRHIEATWGITARNFYGMADVAADMAAECDEAAGMHFCAQAAVIAELIDPASLQPIELSDGAEGEIVFTTIDREATPVVRYRIRDVVRIEAGACPCGRTSFRFRVIGRTDDMLKVKGVNVFPAAVKEVISSFAPGTTGEMRIVLKKPGPAVGENLHIKVEHGHGLSEAELEELKDTLTRTIREKLVFRPVIELVPPDTFPKSEYKIEYFENLF